MRDQLAARGRSTSARTRPAPACTAARMSVPTKKRAVAEAAWSRWPCGVVRHRLVGEEVHQLDVGRRLAQRLQRGHQRARRGAGGADEDMAAAGDLLDRVGCALHLRRPGREARVERRRPWPPGPIPGRRSSRAGRASAATAGRGPRRRRMSSNRCSRRVPPEAATVAAAAAPSTLGRRGARFQLGPALELRGEQMLDGLGALRGRP